MTSIEPSYSGRVYPRLALLSAGLFTVGTNAFVIAGLLPDIATTLGTTQSSVSYSITLYALVVAVMAPAVSILLPRVSRTALIGGGLLVLATGTFMAAAAGSLELFTLGRMVAALGGAALVPTATAAAPAMVPPGRHGKALAFVAIGFTLASAVGSPLGTALGEVGGWRFPLYLLGALSAVVGIAVLLTIRRIPLGRPISLRQRVGALRDPRIVLALVATVFVMAGFNIVYIFSAMVTAPVTGGSGALLSLLLLVFGGGGVLGNIIAGPLTDRMGNRSFGSVALVVEVVALLAVPLLGWSYLATAIAFAVWGIAALAATIPLQHRMVSIDPATAGLAMSWYTTAMYVGIAIAPPLGAAAANLGGAIALPLAGAGATTVALLAFQFGYVRRRASTPGLIPVAAD